MFHQERTRRMQAQTPTEHLSGMNNTFKFAKNIVNRWMASGFNSLKQIWWVKHRAKV